MQKGFDELAEKAFLQAIALYAHHGKAYFNLARLQLKNNRTEQAWQSLKNACTIADYDTHPECLLAYAQTSMSLKKFDDAVTGYRMLAHIQQLDPDSALNLADAYAVLNNYGEAMALYQQLLDSPSREVHAHHNLCEICCRQKNYAQGLAVLNHLEQKNLGYPDMQIKKAECLYHTNNRAQARATLQNFIKTTGNFPLRCAAQKLLGQMV